MKVRHLSACKSAGRSLASRTTRSCWSLYASWCGNVTTGVFSKLKLLGGTVSTHYSAELWRPPRRAYTARFWLTVYCLVPQDTNVAKLIQSIFTVVLVTSANWITPLIDIFDQHHYGCTRRLAANLRLVHSMTASIPAERWQQVQAVTHIA